jgi:hypothetical protein
MASELVGKADQSEVPLSQLVTEAGENVGDMFVDRLVRTNDKKVQELVRAVAQKGARREGGDKQHPYVPTQEMVDLFSQAYQSITRTGYNTSPLSSAEKSIVQRIARDFVQGKEVGVTRLYAAYPNPTWPKDQVQRIKDLAVEEYSKQRAKN